MDYYYDENAVLEERNASDGSLLAHYNYADRLLSLNTEAGIQYYHHDALGSTVNLTDSDGVILVSYTLDPWGNIRSQSGESVNRQIFTGQEHDENTGLIYFGARYYDPDIARFITQDSYFGEQGTPPSLHRYLYAYSNPTVYIDLDGHSAKSKLLIASGVVVRVVSWGLQGVNIVEDFVTAGVGVLEDAAVIPALLAVDQFGNFLIAAGTAIEISEMMTTEGFSVTESIEVIPFENYPTPNPGRYEFDSTERQNQTIIFPEDPNSLPELGGYGEGDIVGPNNPPPLEGLSEKDKSIFNDPIISEGSNPAIDSKPTKGTPEGDQWRYDRYKNSGGMLSYDDWYPKSRGGRSGGAGHQEIQNQLEKEGIPTEVTIGNRIVDAANESEIHQIGGLNKRGDPIKRERDAIEDVLTSSEYERQTIYYWDKANPNKLPIKNPHEKSNWVGN